MASKICVIMPAYNVAGTVGEVVAGALNHVSCVLVADDGSCDDTAARAAGAGATVIRIAKNRGKGHALKVLFQRALALGYDAVISMDADGQHEPDRIPLFLQAHARYPRDLIVGSRMQAKAAIPRARYNAMHVARFFISIAANQFVEDTQCGFRLYPLALIDQMTLTQGGYVTESEILMKAGDLGRQLRSVYIGTIYGDHVSHFRPILDVGAITTYIISYLMIKFAIEGLRPDCPFAYRKNGLRDMIGRFRFVDRVFQMVSLFTIFPATGVFLTAYHLLPPLIGNTYASIRRLGCGYYRITLATNMLPVIMAVLIFERALHRFGITTHLTDGFIRTMYPGLWSGQGAL